MGNVMQESAGIAYTYVRHIAAAERFEIGADFFEGRQIHLHIPEGATPKDGPSARRDDGHRADVAGPRQADQAIGSR